VKSVVFEIPTSHLTISGHPPGVTVSPTKQPSLEERIVALEQAQRQQSDLIADVRGRVDKEAQVRASELKSERRERAVVDNKIRGLLEEASAGGLHIEWVGVVWLFLGLILGTASMEIAKELVKLLGG
jgi:hypothetical protein